MGAYVDLNFQVIGADQLITKIGKLDTLDYLRPPIQRGLYRLLVKMASYPPKPKDSTYRRTGTYGRKWTTKISVSKTRIQGSIGINLKYAPWVGSHKFQTDTHKKTGWVTDKKAVELERPAIEKDCNDAIKRQIG